MTSEGTPLSAEERRQISTIFDKKGEKQLLLDWNAFDPVSAIKEPELKDIAHRLCPELKYDDIRLELKEATVKKRKEMLKFAKDQVVVRMLDECQRMEVVTFGNRPVNNKESLREYFKEAGDDEEHRTVINQVTNLCFNNSPRWKEDLADEMMDRFGIGYDPHTIKSHENGKGNGFYEKIITKALCNARADLRSAQGRASLGASSYHRIKRDSNDAYDNDGRYLRKKRQCMDTDNSDAQVSKCIHVSITL